MESIVVDSSGSKLAYLDSGAPSDNGYITAFLLHGMVFSAHIFEKLIPLAPQTGLRVVAINRRDYPGSSSTHASELSTLEGGSDEQKAALLRKRGVEIGTFIDRFILQNGILPISADGKTGGIVIVGWSLGVAFALAALANVDILPSDAQARFATYLRSVILEDPAAEGLGMPRHDKAWAPFLDDSITTEERCPFFNHWISGYFKHGDLTKRDFNEIAYITPSTYRAPSIYSMSDEQQKRVICQSAGLGSDMLLMVCDSGQLNASYKKACFDKALRDLVPRTKFWVMKGDMSPSSPVLAYFSLQDDDETHGGEYLHFKVINGTNHFIHWDDPQLTLYTYLSASL